MKIVKGELYWWGEDLYRALESSSDQLVGTRVASFTKIFKKPATYHAPIPIKSEYVNAFRPIPSSYNSSSYLRFLIKSLFLEGK
jgi:hypothetical protein